MEPLIKLLLTLGVQVLAKVIPSLAGLLGGPFGFLVSWAISFLTGVLYKWAEKLARYRKIDIAAEADRKAVEQKQLALEAMQKNPNRTEEERAKAIADFAAAVSKFGNIRLQ